MAKNNILELLKRHHVGVLVGAVVGFIAFLYLKIIGFSMAVGMERHGLLDAAFSRGAAPANLPDIKIALTLILLGTMVGYAISLLIRLDKKKIRTWF